MGYWAEQWEYRCECGWHLTLDPNVDPYLKGINCPGCRGIAKAARLEDVVIGDGEVLWPGLSTT